MNNQNLTVSHPRRKTARLIARKWRLYLLLVIPLAWLLIFRYAPMGGVLMAFEDYRITKGIFGSEWVGLKYFAMFFNSPNFATLLWNTLALSVYSLIVGFPMPILLAFALNECRYPWIKKTIQTITFLPYFISTVVLISILSQLFHTQFGIVNILLSRAGFPVLNVVGTAPAFRNMYVWSGVWQGVGYNAIIYIAALTSVDPSLREAATIDGASRLQKLLHIDFPAILPTVIITLLLSLGSIMGVGFEKALLMQTSANMAVSEIISTYVYKVGIQGGQYSFGTAVGLFNSAVNLILLATFNVISKKWGETSLW